MIAAGWPGQARRAGPNKDIATKSVGYGVAERKPDYGY